MFKRIISLALSLMMPMSFAVAAMASGEASGSGEPSSFGGASGFAAGEDYSETAALFEQHEYADADGNVMPYNLYLPDGYEESDEEYPLVIFVADASVNGDTVTAPLSQTGAVIWATPEEQAKHPCIVLVPQYTRALQGALSDLTAAMGRPYTEGGWTNGLTLLKMLMDDVVMNYRVDKDRIYGTGQSQGGMAMIAVSCKYPDFFAGVYLVACQWDPSVMDVMADDNIWIVVCEGDTMAYPYMSSATARWAELGGKVAVGEGFWDLNATEDELAAAASDMMTKDAAIRFNAFSGGSHMVTWTRAYAIEPIRDWLFQQVKD